MTSQQQSDKSISDLLAEIGVYHTKSVTWGHRDLRTTAGQDGIEVHLGSMEAHTAAQFYEFARAAA